MFRLTSALVGAAILVMAGPAGAAGLSDYVGTWERGGGDSIERLEIQDIGGGRLRIRGFGVCSPTPCEWGEAQGLAYAGTPGGNPYADTFAVIATWNTGFSRMTLVLSDPRAGRVTAHIYTAFTDGSGRSNYAVSQRLRQSTAAPVPIPTPPLPPLPPLPPGGGASYTEDCVTFNPATAQVRRVRGSWKIVDGSQWIADFGSNEAEAREAFRVIRHYNIDRQCFVGRPNPGLTYWLRGDRIPSGAMPGEDCIRFDRNRVRAEFTGGQWKVTSGPQHMFAFGPNEDEAREAAAIIRDRGFTFSCFVGRPDPSMTYLRR